MLRQDERLGLWSVLVAAGGLFLSLLTGMVLPAVMAAVLLVLSQFFGLILGVVSRTSRAGTIGMIASAALLFVGVLLVVPYVVDFSSVGPETPQGPEPAGGAAAYGRDPPALAPMSAWPSAPPRETVRADAPDVPVVPNVPDVPPIQHEEPPVRVPPAQPKPDETNPKQGELFPKVPSEGQGGAGPARSKSSG